MISRYFKIEELECPCCKKCEMDDKFLNVLDRIRTTLGKPIVVNSGYRCDKYNKKIGGKRNSAHVLGLAADLLVANSQTRLLIVKYALDCNITRIGIGKNFIHIDMGDDHTGHPPLVMWHYYE